MSAYTYLQKRIAQAKAKIALWVGSFDLATRRIAYWKKVRSKHAKGSPKWIQANNKVGYWNDQLLIAKRKLAYWREILDNRVAKKKKWLAEHPDPEPTTLLVSFDGHQVPAWIVEILKKARASGVWTGVVFSGYRSPEYCRQLCQGICGHDSCSGLCAGVSSNHACPPTYKGSPYEGAVDVTDYVGLRHWCENHGNPLIGGGRMLPNDPVHFSRTGR